MKRLPLAIALAACHAADPRPHFIEDDFARARADAIDRDLPLFVEVAAPW